jgi:RimJ/RimL family protein N-acetyltransferase
MNNERMALTTSKDGVLLLEFIPQDAQPLFELIESNRDHLSQFGDETGRKYPDFESVLAGITHPKNPQKIRLGIWVHDCLAGTINITPWRGGYTSEIGYWVGSQFGRQGLATIATKRVIEYGKRNTFTDKMIAHAHKENLYSQRVLLRAGMNETHRDDENIWFSVNTES